MLRRIPFVVALLVVSWLLLTPLSEPAGPSGSDKVVHCLLFVSLALTGLYARIPLLPLGLALVAYAAGTEVLQAVLPIHRDGNVFDGLADTLGVALGVLAWRIMGQAAPTPVPKDCEDSPKAHGQRPRG